MFKRRLYKIFTINHGVYVEHFVPIEKWGEAGHGYRNELRQAVNSTIDKQIWTWIEIGTESKEYFDYTATVKRDFAIEFKISENEISIDRYHGDTFVLSFIGKPGIRYPNFYKGIQLKVPLA